MKTAKTGHVILYILAFDATEFKFYLFIMEKSFKHWKLQN
jgi:hypothetical protein